MENKIFFVEYEIMRRLSFKAEYDVTCDLHTINVGRAVLRSTLTHRRDQIQRICADSEYIIYILFVIILKYCYGIPYTEDFVSSEWIVLL